MSNKKTANRKNNAFVKAAAFVLSSVFPNRCVFCHEDLAQGCCICTNCIDTLEYIGKDRCQRCGAPLFMQPVSGSGNCVQCEGASYAFRRNESMGLFTGRIRKLIHLFKFEDRRSLGGVFAALALTRESGLRRYISDHEVFVPVPLASSRHDTRGYNQSFLIARELSRLLSVNCRKKSVVRSGRSLPQSSIGHLPDRFDNMKDRFAVRRREEKYIKNRDVLLIDDVLTSGATASACAQALLDAGARTVDLFTVARAIKGGKTTRPAEKVNAPQA